MDDSWLTTDGVLSDRTDAMSTRLEKDTLGELPVPQAALYGVQTERARRNFPISHQFPLAPFVDAVVWIKKAAALTNKETGRLEARLADAIVRAADEVLAGQHRDQFVVDPYQAGAGTSHNMNCNEVLKSGRTHLQDATPIRLGQEFAAYGHTIERHRARLARAADDLRDLGIGGTAVGTGLNAEPRYPKLMVKHLQQLTGLELREGADRVQLTQSLGDPAAFSAALRTYAVDLGKIASDIRLLASGPRTGLA